MAYTGRYKYSPGGARIFKHPREQCPRWRRHRLHSPRRRHSIQSPPHCLRLLHLSQLCRPARGASSRGIQLLGATLRRTQLRFNQHFRPIQPKSLADIVSRAVQARPEAKAVLPCRLVDRQVTPMMIQTRKKRDNEIDNKRKVKFLIDSTALKTAKGRSRGNMNCEVELFEPVTNLTIKVWINQMETYFTIGQVPPKHSLVSC